LLVAAVQRLAAAMSLEELLLKQDLLVARFRERLQELESEMGIRVDQVEIQKVRPLEESLLRDLSAEVEERVRDEAAKARLATSERVKAREIESADRIGRDEAAARRQQLERALSLRLAEVEHERETRLREQEVAREQHLAEEATALELARATLARREVEFAAQLDATRREAEARRDAILAVAGAEEQKPQAVRDHELARLAAEKVAEALGHLPLKDARWITVSGDSPVASLGGLITAAGEVMTRGRKTAT
jgi:hypothetical protein